MKTYAKDSPEAMARVLAMTMITDARLDDRELDAMDRLRLYELMGLSREDFSRIVKDYCDDLLRGGGASNGKIDLMDRDRIDAVIDSIDDSSMRLKTAHMILAIAKADGQLHDTELALFRHVLSRWGLSLEQLASGSATI
ncbi:MAG: TerB family tellurite resistance protein [Betaproteobacteria bacterium]|nr:TerB family tellurite resistance protein [Betaproteobacteria bacterium]